MRVAKPGLWVRLAALLLAASPLWCAPSAESQESGDGTNYRIKRPVEGSAPAPQSNQTGKPLQGGVTRVGVIKGVDASTTPTPDIRQAFPTLEPKPPVKPLTGRAEARGPIETPPVLLPANAIGAPPEMYRGWLEKTHPEFSLQTSTMAPNRLVIVWDKYDDTGRTLSSLGLRFTTIGKRDLDGYDLSAAQVVVIDCGPENLTPVGALKIQQFVARGGYLFTTDWMIDRLNQHIFPGFIAWNGAMNRQKMYDATIYGKNPVLFKNVVTNAHWKMDIHCHLIRVLNKDAVKVLATSKQLLADDPDGQGILAVVFPYGQGQVMHMTAHFDRSQRIIGFYLADPAPVIGISLRQALAINYVVAGLTGVKP